jgi:FKBP-type peptidyl-prolyl cis-trans isomerase 2
VGSGQIIPGFDRAVVGMEPGESKTITIPSEEAYGPRRQDQVLEVDKEMLPGDLDPEIGQQLEVQQQNGATAVVTVTDVGDSTITLDANHPLAGKDLIFDIEMVSVDEG